MAKIDIDRGVMFMVHPTTGMYVYMYFDKPGVYLNAHEHPVSEAMAKEAGFDIERFAKDRLKRERMAQAKEAIERELSFGDEKKEEVVRECSGFKVVDIGYDRFNVKDPDGNVLNTHPLSREIADKLLVNLVPEAADQPQKQDSEEGE